jgi:hypothetical protein
MTGSIDEIGGAFGIAIAGAAFAATGGYVTRDAFSDGFTTAYAVAAGMALAGALAAIVLPGRKNRPLPSAPARATSMASAGR